MEEKKTKQNFHWINTFLHLLLRIVASFDFFPRFSMDISGVSSLLSRDLCFYPGFYRPRTLGFHRSFHQKPLFHANNDKKLSASGAI